MKRVADKLLAWLNLRTLVAAAGLVLLFAPELPDFLNRLDRQLFQAGVRLHTVPAPTLGVSTVELPAEEVEWLMRDPGRATRTLELLSRVTASDKIRVGLLLPAPVAESSPSLNQLLSDLLGAGEGLDNEPRLAQLQDYHQIQRGLHEFSEHDQLSWQLARPGQRLPVQTESSAVSAYLDWLPGWLRPGLPPHDAASAEMSTWLLTQGPDGLRPGLALDLYARFSNSSTLRWREYWGVGLDGLSLPTAPDSEVIPYPHSPRSAPWPLERALSERLDHNLILLGPVGSPELARAANALRSLDSNSYYHRPVWFLAVEALLLLLLTIYLFNFLPRLSRSAGFLASSLLLTIILVAQLGWQITQWQWLPMGVAAQYLLAGHLLMLLWMRQRGRVVQLQAAAHGARYQLGLQLFRDGRSDDALLAIRECHTTDAVLGLMYDVASQQERKRHYGEALKTYQVITNRKKHFRDAAEKVEKLMAFSSGGASNLTNTGEVAKTLIISESSINKPVLGRYEIERELGRGAMGVVYLGRDPKIARQVAIKTLSYGQLTREELDEFKQRFFREAEAAGRLSHPNIVTVYDVGEEHDLAFIAMDYVRGSALSAYTDRDSQLPMGKVLEICAEAADALEYAHSRQVIHRDIKPANIMYEPENDQIKVTDFGVARIADSARTNTGDILGSPLYMSPEQLKGERVDRRTDIYSLGVTLFQLLTGELPFKGDNLANLTYNIIHEKPPGIRKIRPDLPTGLTRIVNKALNKDPAKRYESAALMAEALRKLLAECR